MRLQALSRRKQGFESPRERHQSDCPNNPRGDGALVRASNPEGLSQAISHRAGKRGSRADAIVPLFTAPSRFEFPPTAMMTALGGSMLAPFFGFLPNLQAFCGGPDRTQRMLESVYTAHILYDTLVYH